MVDTWAAVGTGGTLVCALSVPVTLASVALGYRAGSFRAGFGDALLGGGALLAGIQGWVVTTGDPLAVLTVAAATVLAAAVLGALPLVLGQWLVVTATGLPPVRALPLTVLAWPVGALAAAPAFADLAGLVAFGPVRGTGAALAWVAVLAAAALGPGLLGTGLGWLTTARP
ncbi:MAG: hypothetical protein ABEJ70_06380 [Halobacteriaceae archaeon]